jgi:hypothetical protein
VLVSYWIIAHAKIYSNFGDDFNFSALQSGSRFADVVSLYIVTGHVDIYSQKEAPCGALN